MQQMKKYISKLLNFKLKLKRDKLGKIALLKTQISFSIQLLVHSIALNYKHLVLPHQEHLPCPRPPAPCSALKVERSLGQVVESDFGVVADEAFAFGVYVVVAAAAAVVAAAVVVVAAVAGVVGSVSEPFVAFAVELAVQSVVGLASRFLQFIK